MTKDEAMKMALEALETLPAGSSYKTHNAASALRQALAQPEQEPFEMKWPDYNESAMGCGIEDRNITDRYEAMQYGWDEAISRVSECLPDVLFTAPPSKQEPDYGIDRGAWSDVPDATKWVDELRGDEEPSNSTTDVVEPEPASKTPKGICRTDGRCQYAIDSGAEGMGWCPEGKCVMPYNVEQPECNPHPDAPHGFNRDASHSLGRYVCDCEGWEPEPVAFYVYEWRNPDGSGVFRSFRADEHQFGRAPDSVIPVPAQLPKQEFVCSTGLCHYKHWVGLTEEEIFDLADHYGEFKYGDAQGHKRIGFARAIEAKLKGKNRVDL